MHWDWILNPLAQYGMVAAGLIACLALFLTVKFELRAIARRAEEARNAVTTRLQAAEAAVERFRETAADAGERQLARLSALNLTKRAQAVRMYRRGEPVETIAAALGTPRNEIELLIKLHEIQQHVAC